MSVQWLIENIEQTEGSNSSVVNWRVNGATVGTGMEARTPTSYGQISVEGLTITPSTTEQEVIEKVKAALNATEQKRDERGALIPPMPGEATARTDAIEASLAAQAQELAHPKTKSVKLPWKAA